MWYVDLQRHGTVFPAVLTPPYNVADTALRASTSIGFVYQTLFTTSVQVVYKFCRCIYCQWYRVVSRQVDLRHESNATSENWVLSSVFVCGEGVVL